MNKTIRIIIPILLAVAIVLCMAWYLFIYDRDFTRDMLLNFARFSENQGQHTVAAWFYNQAYAQSGDNDSVAIELAEQYKKSGNYTKAEYTLSNAIADGGGIDLYVALCKTYVEQDKLLDAVNMLNSITNTEIKEQLNAMRPAAPTAVPDPGFYSQYISATIETADGTTYYSVDGQYPSTATDPYSGAISLGDGENTIYAITVAENGLVSTLSIFGYTIGGVIEVVEFADAAIEAEIRSLLSVSEDTVLYTNDLWTIKSFTVPEGAKSYADIKNLSFLETLTIENGVSGELTCISSLANLTQLTISNTAVSQEVLSTIATLPLLKNLTLQSCSLSSIAGLKGSTSVVTLDLNNNTIRNIDVLSAMTNLQELNLQHNALTDLSALSANTALTRLDISYNALTSIAPVSVLTGLTSLDAGSNSITELGEIGKLTSLNYLNLASNKLTNITALTSCTALTQLNISSNALTDIECLSALTQMLYFDFSHNQVKTIPSFPKNCALVSIDGSNNLLSSLKPLAGLENLNVVNMDYNTDISSVAALASCPVLLEVNVYATSVTDVSALTNQSIVVNYNPVS